MADWSANHRACTTLWSTLFYLHQFVTNFDDSGDLIMSDLTYYNPLSSSEQRRLDAMMLADQLDNIFRIARHAQYEKNIDRTQAMSRMLAILLEPKKMVKDLAEVVDVCYRFWGENTLSIH